MAEEEPTICSHPDFNVLARVDRIEDIGEFSVDITVECAECGMPFVWQGMMCGSSLTKPMTDITAFELRAPIKPFAAGLPIQVGFKEAFEEIKKAQRGAIQEPDGPSVYWVVEADHADNGEWNSVSCYPPFNEKKDAEAVANHIAGTEAMATRVAPFGRLQESL